MDFKQQSQILALYQMILADDDVNILELKEFNRIATEKFGLSQEELTAALFTSSDSVYIPETQKEKVEFLYNLAIMAWSDGVLAPEEKQILKKYVLKFGFPESDSGNIMDFLLSEAKEANTFDKVWEKIINN